LPLSGNLDEFLTLRSRNVVLFNAELAARTITAAVKKGLMLRNKICDSDDKEQSLT
jgi:hypothetical protein